MSLLDKINPLLSKTNINQKNYIKRITQKPLESANDTELELIFEFLSNTIKHDTHSEKIKITSDVDYIEPEVSLTKTILDPCQKRLMKKIKIFIKNVTMYVKSANHTDDTSNYCEVDPIEQEDIIESIQDADEDNVTDEESIKNISVIFFQKKIAKNMNKLIFISFKSINIINLFIGM